MEWGPHSHTFSRTVKMIWFESIYPRVPSFLHRQLPNFLLVCALFCFCTNSLLKGKIGNRIILFSERNMCGIFQYKSAIPK